MGVTTRADDPLGPSVTASTFNHEVYLANAVEFAAAIDKLRSNAEHTLTDRVHLSDGSVERVFTHTGRVYMTRNDPMLFALVYCRNLITDDAGHISFAELHLELCRYVQQWKEPIKARESRTAFVAPREATNARSEEHTSELQ